MAQGGFLQEERGGSDSKWHWNIALAATIEQYAGLASSGHQERLVLLMLRVYSAGDRCEGHREKTGAEIFTAPLEDVCDATQFTPSVNMTV